MSAYGCCPVCDRADGARMLGFWLGVGDLNPAVHKQEEYAAATICSKHRMDVLP
jgi:hypothetical protein